MSKRVLVQDPIYTLIEISPLCKIFMDSPEFQRLKRIKQLGNTHNVFPSGTHSRFEHSLGVMFLSGQFYKNLLSNSDPKWASFDKYLPLIELGGMLHDVGHGPFSHVFEEAMRLKNIPFSHEQRGVDIIKRLNERVKAISDEEYEIVKNIVLGFSMEGLPDFLFQIVSNRQSGLDTDKMDYLVRDAYHIGKPRVAIDYIYKNSVIDEFGHIAYHKKTENDIATLFTTRKLMYEQVYFHKTVIKIDRIMICALIKLDLDVMNLDRFLELDDEYLRYQIKYVLRHPFVECLDYRRFKHSCDYCPKVELKRVAKLSSNTDDNPLLHIRFVN